MTQKFNDCFDNDCYRKGKVKRTQRAFSSLPLIYNNEFYFLHAVFGELALLYFTSIHNEFILRKMFWNSSNVLPRRRK